MARYKPPTYAGLEGPRAGPLLGEKQSAVTGRAAKNVPRARGLGHVAGYTIANGLSARDMGRRPDVSDTSPFRFDWVAHKSFDGSCPLGPWIVPVDDIPDPQRLGLKL